MDSFLRHSAPTLHYPDNSGRRRYRIPRYAPSKTAAAACGIRNSMDYRQPRAARGVLGMPIHPAVSNVNGWNVCQGDVNCRPEGAMHRAQSAPYWCARGPIGAAPRDRRTNERIPWATGCRQAWAAVADVDRQTRPARSCRLCNCAIPGCVECYRSGKTCTRANDRAIVLRSRSTWFCPSDGPTTSARSSRSDCQDAPRENYYDYRDEGCAKRDSEVNEFFLAIANCATCFV